MGAISPEKEIDAFEPAVSSICYSSPCSSASSSGVSYIEHRVSKMDTLAGIAIKYGVEVADIKRMNGLVTDLQMFAHKSLQIPLPGRHPPSPAQSNGYASNRSHIASDCANGDVLESFRSLNLKYHQPGKLSPAMSRLQGYYGLTPPRKHTTVEGTEMTVYRRTGVCPEGEPLQKLFPDSILGTPTQDTKIKSLVNSYLPENGEFYKDMTIKETGDPSDGEKCKSDKSVRRRQKVDVDAGCNQELIFNDDSTVLTVRTVKGAAARPKSSIWTDLKSVCQNANPVEDTAMFNGFIAVKKSSSTSNLQESDGGSSLWPSSKWTLKPDSITKPILDGLPKPILPWKSKDALD